jgi:hypothetical protein
MPRRGSRTFVVSLERDAVLGRLRTEPPRQSGPVKNLFSLARPEAPNALRVYDDSDRVDVTWAEPSKPGLVHVRARALDSGTTEVELRPFREETPAWERGGQVAAVLMMATPFLIHVSGINLLFLVGVVLLYVLGDRAGERRKHAKQCDAVADEAYARMQPFVLPPAQLGPYRGGPTETA